MCKCEDCSDTSLITIPTGPTGSQGDIGPTGLTGATGLQGPAGIISGNESFSTINQTLTGSITTISGTSLTLPTGTYLFFFTGLISMQSSTDGTTLGSVFTRFYKNATPIGVNHEISPGLWPSSTFVTSDYMQTMTTVNGTDVITVKAANNGTGTAIYVNQSIIYIKIA